MIRIRNKSKRTKTVQKSTTVALGHNRTGTFWPLFGSNLVSGSLSCPPRRAMESHNNSSSHPKFQVGTKFWKLFEGYDEPFQGTITSYDAESGYYHGVYEDGDEEDYLENEMSAMIQAEPKSSNTPLTEQQTTLEKEPFALGTKFWKLFDGYDEPFQGTITSYDAESGYYHGVYEDGDEEDFSEKEMEKLIRTGDKSFTLPSKQIDKQKGPFALGTKFWKLFDGYDEPFQGTISSYDAESGYYHSVYEDGDEEDLSDNEMEKLILAGKPKKKKKKRQEQDVTPKAVAKTVTVSSRSGRKVQQVSYDMNVLGEDEFTDNDSDDESDDSHAAHAKKKSRRASTSTPLTMSSSSITKHLHMSPSVVEGRAIDFDAYRNNIDMLDNDDSMTNSKSGNKHQKNGSKNGKNLVPSFHNIVNVPLFPDRSLQDIHEFLDPRGMEAAGGDIVDRLVGDQVSKMGGLLVRALSSDNKSRVAVVGTREVPLTLGTAFTATDSVALALTLVTEQMKARLEGCLAANTDTVGGGSAVEKATAVSTDKATPTRDAISNSHTASIPKIYFSHEFSCENDYFKQEYLARNSQSIVYPSISESYGNTDSKKPPMPTVNAFVAKSTSKNDFSMSRATKAFDMERKRHSGDTFMAIVDVILQKQPQICLLEIEGDQNKALLPKLQQYLTGRIRLSDCDAKSALETVKDKQKDLVLSYDEALQKIVVEEVPSFCGVQCGASVAGYMKGDEGTIHSLVWPPNSAKGTNSTCTLSELATANKIDQSTDTLVLDRSATYCAKVCKFDAQHYGLPHLREWTYLFVWQPLQQPPKGYFENDDLGDYWEGIVQYLKTPLLFSLEAFLLEHDNHALHTYRDSLSKSSGSTANLGNELPPHYWREYLECQPQHILERLAGLRTEAASEAETHDANFSSFCWDISERSTSEALKPTTPGVVGSIDPDSIFFLSHKGRPLLGIEKLLIQGLPTKRLVLGDETEEQLGDLAANSMSLTVASAAMVAAIVSPQLREEMKGTTIDDSQRNKANGSHSITKILEYLEQNAALENKGAKTNMQMDWMGRILPPVCSPYRVSDREKDDQMCDSLLAELAKLAPRAVESARSLTEHGMNNLENAERSSGMEESFEGKLRGILPKSLYLKRDSVDKVADIGEDHYRFRGLDLFDFTLHKIMRD